MKLYFLVVIFSITIEYTYTTDLKNTNCMKLYVVDEHLLNIIEDYPFIFFVNYATIKSADDYQ